MRLLITADLHFNHPRSRKLAEELIAQINRAGADILLLVGDTSVPDGETLEQCLSLIKLSHAKKLFVAGNHELWTKSDDSYGIYTQSLPKRVGDLGWQYLDTDPFVTSDLAIVGSVGWYDYSFAQESLGIPRRFYEAKVSPGAADRFEEYTHLFQKKDDIPPAMMDVFARWNDGRFVKLHRSDDAFLQELLDRLGDHLRAAAHSKQIIAAIHHLPFAQLLPPPHSEQWDFAKAYLGSRHIGELLLQFPNITHLYCGHSHFPIQARIQHINAINIGSGYRAKQIETLDLPD